MKSGLYLPISSLPDKFGCGSLGYEAESFIKFLSVAKQSYWDIGTITYLSSFAIDSLLVDLDYFVEKGLLCQQDLVCEKKNCLDIDHAREIKLKLFSKAYVNYFAQPNIASYHDFCDLNKEWLDDYALFCAVKLLTNKSWLDWDDDIKFATEQGKIKYNKLCEEEIEYYKFEQYILREQFVQVFNKATQANIKLIGQISQSVPLESADVWANQNIFLLGSDKLPKYKVDLAKTKCENTIYPAYNYKALANSTYLSQKLDYAKQLFDIIKVNDLSMTLKVVAIDIKRPKIKKIITNRRFSIDKLLIGLKNQIIVEAQNIGKTYKKMLTHLAIPTANTFKKDIISPRNSYANCVCYLEVDKSLDDLTHINEVKTQIEDLFASSWDEIIINMQDLSCLDGVINKNDNYMAQAKEQSSLQAQRIADLTAKYNR
ncbi:MAG: 4-alpha-glucanotransferase [Clostridia bacterium]